MLIEECKTLRRSMLPTNMSPMRACSPAVSEISVGSPSPPLLKTLRSPATAFQVPLHIKRLRSSTIADRTKMPSESQQSAVPSMHGSQRKSSAERVKSFTIADILGNKEGNSEESQKSKSPPRAQSPTASVTIETSPLLSERLQPLHGHPTLPPSLHGVPPVIFEIPGTPLAKSSLTPWDPTTLRGPLPLRPFFSSAHLLQYEQRLAWDYQRQLQEHFQLQAQMLRQMSMEPNVIQSEDGSERDSRSRSSTGSACYSPEVNVNSNDSISCAAERSNDGGTGRVLNGIQEKGDSNAGNGSVDKNRKAIPGDTPLDALFQLSTKNFDEEQDPATLSIFATRPNPKKKRKSRTAFTNHQIFELEKRFLYQKYLSPADRDEIAASLGLSNAQVITWFQNRRAKLKRDMEELKKDVESVKQLSANKSFLENVNDLSILKTRPVSRHQTPAAVAVSATPTPTNATGPSIFNNGATNQSISATMATPISHSNTHTDHIAIDDNHLREIPSQHPRIQKHNTRG